MSLFEVPSVAAHPARYGRSVVDVMQLLLEPFRPGLLLDPFAGTGRVHELRRMGWWTVGVELEPEWAHTTGRTLVGNALHLPFAPASFAAIATSPTYGNRLADHHQARDGSVRHSYTHDLGRRLHPDNSGALQWGEVYREFHRAAWAEARRVLHPEGPFLLNVKDHVRQGRWVPVTAFHLEVLEGLGLRVTRSRAVDTGGMRYGANRDRLPEVVYRLETRN